jgi:HEAT repeats
MNAPWAPVLAAARVVTERCVELSATRPGELQRRVFAIDAALASLMAPGGDDRLGEILAALPSQLHETQALAREEGGDELVALLVQVSRDLAMRKDALAGAVATASPSPVEEWPFVASLGLPRVHDVPKQPYREALLIEEDEADDRSRPTALESNLVQQALETVRVALWLRSEDAARPWTPHVRPFEERALANVDLLIALARESNAAPFVTGLRELLGGAALRPQRLAAAAFILGCLRDDDAHRLIRLAVRRDGDGTRQEVALALALAPSPAVEDIARELLYEETEETLAMALDVLAMRGSATVEDGAALLAHPSAVVRAAAVRAVATARHEGAVSLLVGALYDEPDPDVTLSLIEGLLRHGERRGLEELRRRLDEVDERRDCEAHGHLPLMMLLAVAGDDSDAERLMRLVSEPRTLTPLGWLGSARVVDGLLASLRAARDAMFDDLALAAGEALGRLTGALTDANGTASVDPDAWERWFRQHGAFSNGTRLRFGEPHRIDQSLDELLGPIPTRRDLLGLEVALLCHVNIPLHAWLPVQVASANELRDRREVHSEPGAWPAHRLGRWHRST